MTGKQLRQRRSALRLTQQKLADLLGVKKNSVYRWESGLLSVPPYLHLALIGLEKTIGKELASQNKSK